MGYVPSKLPHFRNREEVEEYRAWLVRVRDEQRGRMVSLPVIALLVIVAGAALGFFMLGAG